MDVSKSKCPPTVIFRRKLKAVDTDAFHTDLSKLSTYHPDKPVTELNAHLTSLPNKCAPVTKHIKKRNKLTAWFVPKILVAKSERRRAERA